MRLGHVLNVLRKYDWVLPLAGACIVFATFVAKEGFRDHYKELSDSLALYTSAHGTQLLNSSPFELSRASRESGNLFILAGDAGFPIDFKPNGFYDQILSSFEMAQSYTAKSIASLEAVDEELPDEDRAAVEFSIVSTGKSSQVLLDKLYREREFFNSGGLQRVLHTQKKMGFRERGKVYDRLEELQDELIVLTLNCSFNEVMVDLKIEITKAKLHGSYLRWSLISTFLYVYGWVIAITGKLICVTGKNGPPEEELGIE
jgi:hypothetical protein